MHPAQGRGDSFIYGDVSAVVRSSEATGARVDHRGQRCGALGDDDRGVPHEERRRIADLFRDCLQPQWGAVRFVS